MNMQEILEQSPDIPGYGGGKWAMYSVGCCWWTSFPEDLGDTAKFMPPGKHKVKVGPDKEHMQEIEVDMQGLPCCPHCGSVLYQSPLEKFIEAAKTEPIHYGKYGIEAFVEAHSRNSRTCYPGWKYYNFEIEQRKRHG